MQKAMVTTALEIPGYRIKRSLGVVRGLTVRSRSVFGNFAGGIQTLFGGNITIYTELCEQARAETYAMMCRQADGMAANAIIGMRYDATELMAGLTEVLCYGTAVVVEPEQ
jgi:uncharacterized protein YbjQ (UPF0145 family)